MKKKSDIKISAYTICFGIPLVLIARSEFFIGLIAGVFFFIAYFSLTEIKVLRNRVSWLDGFVIGSYIVLIIFFLLLDEFVSDSNGYKALAIIFLGIVLVPVYSAMKIEKK